MYIEQRKSKDWMDACSFSCPGLLIFSGPYFWVLLLAVILSSCVTIDNHVAIEVSVFWSVKWAGSWALDTLTFTSARISAVTACLSASSQWCSQRQQTRRRTRAQTCSQDHWAVSSKVVKPVSDLTAIPCCLFGSPNVCCESISVSYQSASSPQSLSTGVLNVNFSLERLLFNSWL